MYFKGAISTHCNTFLHIKSQVQVERSVEARRFQGLVSSLVSIGREEGLRGYFKGNGTNVVRIIPYVAVQFAAYEEFKKVFMPVLNRIITIFTMLYIYSCLRFHLILVKGAHCVDSSLELWLASHQSVSPTPLTLSVLVSLYRQSALERNASTGQLKSS